MVERVEVGPCAFQHVAHVMARMRAIDRLEYDAMVGEPYPAAAVWRMVQRSRGARAVSVGGTLVGVYGLAAPHALSVEAHPWLVATTDLEDSKPKRRAFAMHSREHAARLLRGFAVYSNWIAEENRLSQRWLRGLGFTVGAETRDVGGVKFVNFTKGSNDVL